MIDLHEKSWSPQTSDYENLWYEDKKKSEEENDETYDELIEEEKKETV